MTAVAETNAHERKITTLASLTPNQIEAIRKIPAEKDAVLVPLLASRPNAIFTSQDHYDREQRAIFRRYPVPITLSALLPEAGMVVADGGYGIPLLVSRTKTGEVKV